MRLSDDILAAFKEGRLEPFYDTVYPRLMMWARRVLGDELRLYAEDLTQNAVYRAWQQRDKFDTLNGLRAYLYTSVRNEGLNLLRKGASQRRYLSQLEDDTHFTTTIIDREARAMLYDAIDRLPAKERQIVILSYIEGLKNHEIEERLGISLASVKRYKSHSLELLRDQLDIVLLVALISGTFSY